MTSLSEARRFAYPLISRLRYTLSHHLTLWLTGLVVVGLGLIGLFPHALSLYHVEAGGRILAAAEAGEATARVQLPQAIAHFEAALRHRPDDAQAQRLLGQTYLALDNPQAAVPALSRFTELRPNHPLGHWELASAYEQIWRQWADLRYYDLVVESPLAQIETPDVPVGTPFCQPGDPVDMCYVATTFQEIDGRKEAVLFQYPPARVTYELELPPEPAVLRLRPGLDPAADALFSDGVGFTVIVRAINGDEDDLLYQAFLAPDAGYGDEARLDLSRYAGQTVWLTLETDPGPNDNNIGDLAGWVAPVVEHVEANRFEEAAQAAREGMVQQWARAGLTGWDFLDAGQTARQAERYAEALAWYDRALAMAPGWAEPWYYIGLVYEQQDSLRESLRAYRRGLDFADEDATGLSSFYFRIGRLQYQRAQPPDLEKAGQYYELALAANNFSEEPDRTRTYFNYAEVLRQQNRGEEAIEAYEWVIDKVPSHYLAHIQLGLLYWKVQGDAKNAVVTLRQAIALKPEEKEAYHLLGLIYLASNRTEEALAMFGYVLEIDPEDKSTCTAWQSTGATFLPGSCSSIIP